MADDDEEAEEVHLPSYHVRISFNIGGLYYETTLATLLKWPNTRLGRLALEHPMERTEPYFFDRNPRLFAEILHYYRRGKFTSFISSNADHVCAADCAQVYLNMRGLIHYRYFSICWCTPE